MSQACGPATVGFQVKVDKSSHPSGSPQSGKALIYVIEDQKTKFVRDVTIRMGLDGSWIGANRGNSYFLFNVEPGMHHLCADWETSPDPEDRILALTGFTAEAGKAYYFRARTLGSLQSPVNEHPYGNFVLDLDPINEDQGQLLIATSGLSLSQRKK